MKKFTKLVSLAAVATFVASSAIASVVSITAMDIDNSGDDVMFSVNNISGQAISMITFDVAQASDVSDMARFNIPMNLGGGDGVFGAGDSGSFDFINTDADSDAEQLKWTFDGDGLGAGSSFSFNAWIQYLNDETAPGLKGGLDVNGDRLFATVVFADGSTLGTFFTSLGAPGDVGKAELNIVPLPASALLLLGGLAGLGAMGRRKKSA